MLFFFLHVHFSTPFFSVSHCAFSFFAPLLLPPSLSFLFLYLFLSFSLSLSFPLSLSLSLSLSIYSFLPFFLKIFLLFVLMLLCPYLPFLFSLFPFLTLSVTLSYYTSRWRLNRQNKGDAITVYDQKPMLDISIEKDRIA